MIPASKHPDPSHTCNFYVVMNNFLTNMIPSPGGGGGGGGGVTPIYGLYRYVPRGRVCFFEVLGP